MSKHIAEEIYEIAQARATQESDDFKSKMYDKFKDKYEDTRKKVKDWILSYDNNELFGRDSEIVLIHTLSKMPYTEAAKFPFKQNILKISKFKIYNRFTSKKNEPTFAKNPHFSKMENGKYVECLDKDINLFIDEVLVPLDLKWGMTFDCKLIISWSHWLDESK